MKTKIPRNYNFWFLLEKPVGKLYLWLLRKQNLKLKLEVEQENLSYNIKIPIGYPYNASAKVLFKAETLQHEISVLRRETQNDESLELALNATAVEGCQKICEGIYKGLFPADDLTSQFLKGLEDSVRQYNEGYRGKNIFIVK